MLAWRMYSSHRGSRQNARFDQLGRKSGKVTHLERLAAYLPNRALVSAMAVFLPGSPQATVRGFWYFLGPFMV
jgi:hypothetical protein